MNVDRDFHLDSRPLVADSITGVRSFAVDKLGRLTGVTHKDVWRPGVNCAACKIGDRMESLTANYTTMIQRYVTGAGQTISSGPVPGDDPSEVKAEHPAGTKGCQCGYWAYFDGSDDFGKDSTVTAVVQGQGVVTVGSKGFRAEKAEIVALVDPTYTEPEPETRDVGRVHRALDVLGDFMYEHRWSQALGLGVLAGGIFTTIRSLAHIDTAAGVIGFAVGIFALAVGGVMIKADFHAIDRRHPEVSPRLKCRASAMKKYGRSTQSLVIHWSVYGDEDDNPIRPERWGAVKRNYPEIPVYSTLTDALADYPLTPPPPPEPVTPANTPNFWELDA